MQLIMITKLHFDDYFEVDIFRLDFMCTLLTREAMYSCTYSGTDGLVVMVFSIYLLKYVFIKMLISQLYLIPTWLLNII